VWYCDNNVYVCVCMCVCKNNHLIGFSMGLVIVAGAYGAGAVSVGCFNLAVAIGIEAATIHLGCRGAPPTPKDC
jgi:hypothetical protein